MTSAALSLEAPRSRAWELAAVGVATPLLYPLSWVLRRGFSDADYAVGFLTFYAAYVINDPHFTVTYLLFYRRLGARLRGPLRARYALAGFVAPIALASMLVYPIVTRQNQVLGVLVQLMYLLVGWHYVKQGFGVLAVLSARRGLPLSAALRRAALAQCFAGWAFAWANPSSPAREYQEKGVIYLGFAHPRWLELATGAALACATAWLALTVVRERARVAWGPLVALLVTVWSWSILSAIDPLVQYVIPALHAIQYFFFVFGLTKNEGGSLEFGRPWIARAVLLFAGALALGFLLFHAAPGVLDAALVPRSSRYTDMGPSPFLLAFYVFVNVHHYLMDNVIWRRENPEAQLLR